MLSYLGDKIVGLTLAVLNVLAPFEVHVTKGVAYADGIEHRADIYRSAARGRVRSLSSSMAGDGGAGPRMRSRMSAPPSRGGASLP